MLRIFASVLHKAVHIVDDRVVLWCLPDLGSNLWVPTVFVRKKNLGGPKVRLFFGQKQPFGDFVYQEI